MNRCRKTTSGIGKGIGELQAAKNDVPQVKVFSRVERTQGASTASSAAWLQITKHHIQAGEADLVGLPADFTM